MSDTTTPRDTTEAEALAPNETAAIITPSTVEAGTHCTFCSATYAKCTEDVLREMRDPKSNDGCCDECRDSSGHQTRYLPLVAALVARTVAARDAAQRAEGLVLPDPKGGCACTPFSQSAGGVYVEHLAEYEPACPEHSDHLYDPRTGEWILRGAQC